MIPGIDPKVDYAFKFVFGRGHNQAVLIHLIEAVLRPAPGERIVQLELLNPFHDKQALDDKLSILDIKARDQRGRLFNIEMQVLSERAFRGRVLYYWSRLYSSQLGEGEDYGLLRPTISICFTDFVLFPQAASYHLTFQPRPADHQFVFSDDLALHILELPKFTRSAEELTYPLDAWLYFLQHGERLDSTALPERLHVPAIQRALEDLIVLTQDQIERERYESRVKAQRDERSRLLHAEDVGLAKGLVRQIHLCQRLLKRPMTPTEELARLSVEELDRLATQLESEVSSRQ